MVKNEKIEYLQNNHFGEWLKTRREVANEMSNKQDLLCVCKRLATGLHENNCTQFQKKVTSETVKKLQHLFTNPPVITT